ncbi:ABC transporter permease subunit [Vibrio hannami]|uniref:ABC transporter permease subunit n=1 Tax=Vibrio hannami TaxID=2717094 RepID=UPI003EBBCC19
MPRAEFSLKERDRTRYIKDRIVRSTVTAGGVGVLLALLLIFFYLLSIVLPIFNSADIDLVARKKISSEHNIIASGVDNYGENAFVFDQSGVLTYLSLKGDTSSENADEILSTKLLDKPTLLASSADGKPWYAYGNSSGQVVVVRPEFNVSFTNQRRILTPDLDTLLSGDPIQLDDGQTKIKQLAFAVTSNFGVFVAVNEDGVTVAKRINKVADSEGEIVSENLMIPQLPKSVSRLLMAPDGSQLFALSGNELLVLVRKKHRFLIREIIDLTQGIENRDVTDINLLAGAQSVLVTHKGGIISQWFDVLSFDEDKRGTRKLTHIRDMETESDLVSLLPDAYKKGFYAFHRSGLLQVHYTTGENLVYSERLLPVAPEVVSISGNEKYLLTLENGKLSVFNVDNRYPEISLKSLWSKVWYENYPGPQFVWQSTASTDSYEAKFSLVPLTFGTLKAALFCMLLSVPIAVFGAIYTAYFMTPAMRRVVKPTIELMEALPTVIIGFLAGMWLAPIVESHLPAIVLMVIALPLSTMVIGILWSFIPVKVLKKVPSGWHALLLIPVLLIISALCFGYSGDIERHYFSGDIRVYLADMGIDFDQRNALVIGIAMGIAVIPGIFTIAEDAIFSVPKHLSDGAMALGATPWQSLTKVVLLTASPGIFSAAMIGLGRAVGETMIVLMATGNTPILDWNILEGMRTLSATIAVEMPESDVGSSHYRLLFLCALILFLFTFAVNSLAEMVRFRLRKKYSSL